MNKKVFVFLFEISLIFLFISLFLINASVIENKYVLLEFYYDRGEVSLIGKSLETGEIPVIEHEIEKEYKIDLISTKDDVIYSFIFDPTKLFSDVEINGNMEGGTLELEEARFYLAVPETKENKKIQVLKDNQVMLEEEVYDVGSSLCRIK